MLLALLTMLLSLINSALAADAPTIKVTAPSDAFNAPYYHPDWFKVGVYEGLTECPPTLERAYAADAVPHEPAVLNLYSLPLKLLVGHTYVVGTYHRSGTNGDGSTTWSITPGSCTPPITPEVGDSARLYAPLLGSWRPSGQLLHATVTTSVPVLDPGHVLYYKYGGADCVDEIDPRHHDGTVILLNATSVQPIELTGGTWLFGVYQQHLPQPLFALTGPNPATMRYRLVKGTCQQVKVVDFAGSILYQPKLPLSSLLNKPKPAQQFSASVSLVGTAAEQVEGGVQLRFDYIRWNHLIVTANVGLDFATYAPLPTTALLDGGGGLGYTRTHQLPKQLGLRWALTADGGIGTVLLHCPNDVYAANTVYSCSADGGGFPVAQLAPWFGPGATLRLLGPTKGGAKVGLDLWATGQIYHLSNERRGRTVSTSDGGRTITYGLDQDALWWFLPRGGIGFVAEW